jgi:hypothetical protein
MLPHPESRENRSGSTLIPRWKTPGQKKAPYRPPPERLEKKRAAAVTGCTALTAAETPGTFLGRFHDDAGGRARVPHMAYVSADSAGLNGLAAVHEQLLRALHVRVKQTHATPPLAALEPDDSREYRLQLEGQELKPLMVLHLLADARCIFNWCVDMGLLDESSFPSRVMPRIQEQQPNRLGDEEVEAVPEVPEPHAFVIR